MRAMRITLNGESKEISVNQTIETLSNNLELQKKRFAVEVNEVIIPRNQHSSYLINDGDVIEIVVAIGGG